MAVETHRIGVQTQGNSQVLDLTGRVKGLLENGKIERGIATVFVIGATAAITTTEFEPGLVETDLRVACERFAPENADYRHEATWHDDNGHSHVRASLIGPSLTVPFNERRMFLGTWQQIILMDFDTRPRAREIVVQVIGTED